MRVLHLVSYSLYSGPMGPTLGLALAQQKLGHEVALAYDVKRGAFNEYEEAAAPHVEPHGLRPALPLTLSAKSTALEWWRDLSALRAVMRDRHELRYDVVHTHLSHDHGLAVLARRRGAGPLLVRTIHAGRSLRPRLGQAFVHARTDGFITRSETHRQALLRAFGAGPERARVVPGSIDARAFTPADAAARAQARRRFGLADDAFVVGHVALITDRGQHELVRALTHLAEPERPHLFFVGRGEGESGLRQLVESLRLGPWVHFAGYLEGEGLLAGYAAMDAAFLAQAGNDASARAALEAMAMGVPLLAVQVDALGELIHAEVGYPLASREPAELARGLRELRGDAQRAERAARGRKLVQDERSFAHEAEATLAAYAAFAALPRR